MAPVSQGKRSGMQGSYTARWRAKSLYYSSSNVVGQGNWLLSAKLYSGQAEGLIFNRSEDHPYREGAVV